VRVPTSLEALSSRTRVMFLVAPSCVSASLRGRMCLEGGISNQWYYYQAVKKTIHRNWSNQEIRGQFS
jgi:hypothetical protein